MLVLVKALNPSEYKTQGSCRNGIWNEIKIPRQLLAGTKMWKVRASLRVPRNPHGRHDVYPWPTIHLSYNTGFKWLYKPASECATSRRITMRLRDALDHVHTRTRSWPLVTWSLRMHVNVRCERGARAVKTCWCLLSSHSWYTWTKNVDIWFTQGSL